MAPGIAPTAVQIGDVWYLITLIGLLIVGLLVSTLVVAATEEGRAARRREARISVLYSFTKSLALGNELDQILDAVARHFLGIFRRPLVVLLPAAEGLAVRFSSAALVFDKRENEIAFWAFANGQEAGCETETFSGLKIRYRPLKTGQVVVGVIGFQTESLKELLPADQRELLSVFMTQTALAITRADLARKATHVEVLQEADKLQRALLNSVSHDLRTPLASVLGVPNTMLEDRALLDVPTQQSLLKTAQDEAQRLVARL